MSKPSLIVVRDLKDSTVVNILSPAGYWTGWIKHEGGAWWLKSTGAPLDDCERVCFAARISEVLGEEVFA